MLFSKLQNRLTLVSWNSFASSSNVNHWYNSTLSFQVPHLKGNQLSPPFREPCVQATGGPIGWFPADFYEICEIWGFCLSKTPPIYWHALVSETAGLEVKPQTIWSKGSLYLQDWGAEQGWPGQLLTHHSNQTNLGTADCQINDPLLKKNSREGRGYSSVVKHLPSVCEAPGSNSGIIPYANGQRERKMERERERKNWCLV